MLTASSETPNAPRQWRLTHPATFEGHCGVVQLLGLAVLAFIGWLDYITGYEFGFFIFYFIPVAINSWYCGRRPGLIIAIGSAICWYLSDLYTHHPYSRAYFIYWEMFMRLVSFLTTALTLSRIRELVLNQERMVSELLSAHNELYHLKKMNEGRRGRAEFK